MEKLIDSSLPVYVNTKSERDDHEIDREKTRTSRQGISNFSSGNRIEESHCTGKSDGNRFPAYSHVRLSHERHFFPLNSFLFLLDSDIWISWNQMSSFLFHIILNIKYFVLYLKIIIILAKSSVGNVWLWRHSRFFYCEFL